MRRRRPLPLSGAVEIGGKHGICRFPRSPDTHHVYSLCRAKERCRPPLFEAPGVSLGRARVLGVGHLERAKATRVVAMVENGFRRTSVRPANPAWLSLVFGWKGVL
jgi:hypothetical protein